MIKIVISNKNNKKNKNGGATKQGSAYDNKRLEINISPKNRGVKNSEMFIPQHINMFMTTSGPTIEQTDSSKC